MAFLEEKRDDIVIRLVRYMQEQAVLRIRSAFFRVKRDQRELIKVCQRNFRKYIALRDWGWFIMNQKTRPMIGRANPEEELRLLALKANEKYGAYDQQLKTKESLLLENENIKQETKALLKQPEKEQGNMSEHHEKQAKMNSQKADLEGQLLVSQEILIVKEEERQMATGDKKVLEQEIISVKKDIEDIDMAIQKLKQEKANQDHTI